MLETNTESTTITLTPTAVQAVKDLLQKKNLIGHALRIFISGGGCSGFQYGLAFERRVRPEDYTFEMDGFKVVVDEVSINYLNGSIVDYINDPKNEGFKIENPNSFSNCRNSCCSNTANEENNNCCGC